MRMDRGCTDGFQIFYFVGADRCVYGHFGYDTKTVAIDLVVSA